MKRANIYMPLAALVLTALAIPAPTQAPFKGVFKGNHTVTPQRSIQATGGLAHFWENSHSPKQLLQGACYET